MDSDSEGPENVCPICPRSFPTVKGIRAHWRIHSAEEIQAAIDNKSQSQHPTADRIQPPIIAPPTNTTSQSVPVANTDHESQLFTFLQSLKANVRVVKRIPKAARFHASQEYTKTLEACINDIKSWDAWFRLLSFPYVAFKAPDRKDKNASKLSLATIIKRNLKVWTEVKSLSFEAFFERIVPNATNARKGNRKMDADDIRTKKCQSKLNDGDVKGAIRILSSEDTIAPVNMEVYLKLLEKHPAPEMVQQIDDENLPTVDAVTESETKVAVFNFGNGSSGGLDGLRPQHLKDMLSVELGENGKLLITRLSTFSDLLLNGHVPDCIIPILYGACLCAFNKKDLSIRPIAIGSTYRRLVAKIACARVSNKLGAKYRPSQLGFGTKGGAEAGAHAARNFINTQHASTKVFLKLDFQNAFNELERDLMLLATYNECPEIYRFVKQCYSEPTKLSFGYFTLLSQRGCQQGDPCGPPLFCLTINEMVRALKSELNIWFLDDGSLGGDPDSVIQDLATVIEWSAKMGLRLNYSKCELMVLGTDNKQEIIDAFCNMAPGITIRDTDISLLGAPLTDSGIASAISMKKLDLVRMVNRLAKLNSHQAFFLLRHSLSIPKLTYLLRTTPCWRAMNELEEYDNYQRKALEQITNCKLDAIAWKEASLSVKFGGMGLRNTTNLCFSSFLGSFHSTYELLQEIVPAYVQLSIDISKEALNSWQTITNKGPLKEPDSIHQRLWDLEISSSIHKEILGTCTTDIEKARILANSAKDSSAWLNTLPCSSLGTLLDNQSFRISVGLRYGLPICHPHTCVCGVEVDRFGRHGLACKKSSGRKAKHETVNDLMKRALVTCGVPAFREPTGCNRSDGKRPDGLTLIPWKRGKPLIWDFTSADTFCRSYVKTTCRHPGGAANLRENAKRTKYQSLEDNFIFYPVAIETMGPWGKYGRKLIDEIGKMLKNSTGETKAKSYLIQRISIANQRGNAASVLGTIPKDLEKFDDVYYVI